MPLRSSITISFAFSASNWSKSSLKRYFARTASHSQKRTTSMSSAPCCRNVLSFPKVSVQRFRVSTDMQSNFVILVLPLHRSWRRKRSRALALFEIGVARCWNDKVSPAGAVLVKSLTLILSLWQRERRAFGPVLAIADSRRNRQVVRQQFYF